MWRCGATPACRGARMPTVDGRVVCDVWATFGSAPVTFVTAKLGCAAIDLIGSTAVGATLNQGIGDVVLCTLDGATDVGKRLCAVRGCAQDRASQGLAVSSNGGARWTLSPVNPASPGSHARIRQGTRPVHGTAQRGSRAVPARRWPSPGLARAPMPPWTSSALRAAQGCTNSLKPRRSSDPGRDRTRHAVAFGSWAHEGLRRSGASVSGGCRATRRQSCAPSGVAETVRAREAAGVPEPGGVLRPSRLFSFARGIICAWRFVAG